MICELCARTRETPGRYPVVLHHFEGKTLCHHWLNRRLEIEGRRLYPDVIPLGAQ